MKWFLIIAGAILGTGLAEHLVALCVRKGLRKEWPTPVGDGLCTAFALTFFVIATAALSAYGRILYGIKGRNKETRLRFHERLSGAARFVVRHIPRVESRFEGMEHLDLTKPSLIVCNHQSHLDLMYVLALAPRMIVLTNTWVWNSPFYGKIIRFADFLPVTEGASDIAERLKSMVEEGYSVMIFPEGTRTRDGRVHRFHRGAFHFAEQLGLNLTLVRIEGAYEVLPKWRPLMHRGVITLRGMGQVSPREFGETYAGQAREARKRYYV